ncbi:MAG: hypothetical protein ACD_62C00182G0002 [uncultured bacterium]|nr:MAG: hypothetical protein ACD_62C00182G0002 [uncultured bacterium]
MTGTFNATAVSQMPLVFTTTRYDQSEASRAKDFLNSLPPETFGKFCAELPAAITYNPDKSNGKTDRKNAPKAVTLSGEDGERDGGWNI